MPGETTLMHALVLPAIGLVAGVLGGLLGIGGGLVIIPALLLILGHEFGPGSLHVYKLAALATAVVLSIPAAWQHVRAGAVIPRMLPAIEAFGVIGVIIGVILAGMLDHEKTIWLQRIFGACMILLVAANVALARRRTSTGGTGACPMPSRWTLIGTRVGLPAGFISGLLGIGGGVWAVPAQNLWMGIRLPSAIANSTCMIVGVAITAAIAQSLSISRMADLDWTAGWRLALWLAPGAVIGGVLGGRLTHALPVGWLHGVFHVLLLLTGMRLLLG